MKRVRYLTLIFGLVMAVAVAALWEMAIITDDLALLAGAAALALLAVSRRKPRSPGRWRLLVAGWGMFIAMMAAAAIIAFASRAEPVVFWGFSALALGGVIVAIWAFFQQKRSRPRYFEGYFRN